MDLTVKASETKTFEVTVTDENSVAIDLTDYLLKFKVFKDYKNDYPFVYKRSYDAEEILKSDPVNGVFVVNLYPEDTEKEAGCYRWAVETYEKLAATTVTGSVSVTEDSFLVGGNSLDLEEIKNGDILITNSTNAPNQVAVNVWKAKDDDGNPTGDLIADYKDWTTESLVTFTVYRAKKKFPEGLCGAFNIVVCE